MGQVISKFAQLNRLPDRAKFVPGSSGDLVREIETAALTGDYIYAVGYFDGYFWGVGNGSTAGMYRSTDGANWTLVAANGQSHLALQIVKAADGELIVFKTTGIQKSSGWSANPATATFTTKATANGQARYTQFTYDGFDPNGQKFIATEYGPGSGTPWADSRYGYISIDAGETWTQVWDSLADTDPLLAVSSGSHLHGCCYDPWNDRFFIAEGHGASRGIYVSEDDGATWQKITATDPANIDAFDAAPTVLIATEYGIVMGTDGGANGLWVLPSIADMTQSVPELLTPWVPEYAAQGTYGFACSKYRDPSSGLVYIGFQTAYNLGCPVYSSDGLTAQEIYRLPTNRTSDAGQRFYDLYVTDSGQFLSRAYVGPTTAPHRYSGQIKPFRRQASSPDTSFATAGLVSNAVMGTQVAIGPGCDLTEAGSNVIAIGTDVEVDGGRTDIVAICSRAPNSIGTGAIVIASNSPGATISTQAIGIGSEVSASVTRAIAIGYRATANGNLSIAIGSQATTTWGFSVIIGALANDASNGSTVVIGYDANASASYDCIIGFSADGTGAGQSKTALGTSAQVAGTGAVALGGGANCAHADGVALGYQVETTAANQVCIEDRHIEFNEMTEPAAPAANGARLYVKDNGSGKSQLCVRFATGAVQVIATEP